MEIPQGRQIISESELEFIDQDQMLDDCNVFVKYLPPDLSDPEFYNLFKSYGPIISSKIMIDQGTGKSLGYGFVRFANSSSSLRAIHHMNGQRVANKRLLCKLANLSPSSFTSEFAKHPLLNYQAPSDNIYIKPLLQDTSEDDLHQLFGKYGKIVDCKVMVDRNTGLSRQIGFVRFETKDQATLAIEEMNNYKLNPSAPPLTVKFADTKEQKTARKAIRQKQFKLEPPRSGNHLPSSPPAYFYSNPSSYDFPYPQYSSFSPQSPYLFSDAALEPPPYYPSFVSQASSSPFLIYEYGSNDDVSSTSMYPYEGVFSPIWNIYDEDGMVPVPEGLGYNYYVEEDNRFNSSLRLSMDTDYFCAGPIKGSFEDELDIISEEYPPSDDYLILRTPQ
jgi:RNA recognition motif-containing protein